MTSWGTKETLFDLEWGFPEGFREAPRARAGSFWKAQQACSEGGRCRPDPPVVRAGPTQT